MEASTCFRSQGECGWHKKVAQKRKTSSEEKQQQEPTSKKAPGRSLRYHNREFLWFIGY